MGLQENMQRESVSRLALRTPVSTLPRGTVRDAVEKMHAANLGCIIVVDPDYRPVGQFTEAMLVQLLRQNPDALSQPLVDHMATQWPWAKLSDPITDVLEALETKNVRFLCVVDDDGRLVGLAGQKGLMEYIAEHFPGQVNVQRIGQKPYTQQREGA